MPTLKISTERLPESQVVLEIEVDPERIEQSMDKAYKRLVGKYRIPGFRPGKAPRIMFERYVGRKNLLREALENLVPEVYEEAVKEESLDPIDQPVFDISSLEPLLIKATVPLKPEVDLGDYRSVRLEREPITVVPEEVDKSLDELRHRYATVQPVERAAQTGDIVSVDIRAEVEGRQILNEQNAELRVTDEALKGLPGLSEKLVGAEKGQSYEYVVDVPEDFEGTSLAGKPISYNVTVHEVKEERLPELDDAFASEVGEGFASFAALREQAESDLRARAQEAADRDYEQKVLDAIIAQAHVEYPPVLIERELESMIREQTGGGRAAFEAALRRAGRSEQEFLDELRPVGTQRVLRSLVLTRLGELEGISVGPEVVEAELDRMANPSTPTGARMREVFDTPSGRQFIERQQLTRRVYERLRDIGEGKELPPLPEPPAGAAGEAEAPQERAEEEQEVVAAAAEQPDESRQPEAETADSGAAKAETDAVQS